MKQFLRKISPRRAARELKQEWQQPNPHRWRILALSLAITFGMLLLFVPEGARMPLERPEVTYITTFDESRTEAQIIASNCANQRLKDELEARLEERAELRRDLYRALGRATFIDVDAMERQMAEDEAAQAAEAPPPPSVSEQAMSVEEYCARAAG